MSRDLLEGNRESLPPRVGYEAHLESLVEHHRTPNAQKATALTSLSCTRPLEL